MQYVSIHAASNSVANIRSALFVLWLFSLWLTTVAPASALTSLACAASPDLKLDKNASSLLADAHFFPDATDFGLVAVDVESAGWVHLEARRTHAGDGDPSAWLEPFVGPPSGDADPCAASFTLVDRHVDEILLRVDQPGRIFLQSGLLNGGSADGSGLTVTTRDLGPDAWRGSAGGPHKNDPGDDTASEEDDILPFAPSDACGCSLSPGFGPRKNDPGDDTASEEDDILPRSGRVEDQDEDEDEDTVECFVLASDPRKNDPGDDTASEEDDILPLTADTCGCASEPANDLAACALTLGPATGARATLSPSLFGAPDRDYYAFELDRPGPVEIVGAGAGARGVLLDGAGRRLAVAQTDGDGFQLETVLPSGRYLLRVESAEPWGEGGEYRLVVNR